VIPPRRLDANAALRKKSLTQLNRLQISDSETLRIIRVESKYAEHLIVDSRDTIVTALFGKKFGGWWFGIMNKTCGNPFSFLWALAMCAMLLCLFGVLPSVAGWSVLAAGLPNLANTWLLCNPHLMWKLVTNFEVLFLTALSTMVTAVMLGAFKYDGRAGCAVLMWAGEIMVIFSDAVHVTQKKFVTAGIAFCLVLALIIIPSFYFGTFPDLNARNIDLSLSDDVDIAFNNVLFIVDKFTTIALFLGKNLFTALRHPGWYVNLMSRLTGEKMTAGELREKMRDRKKSVSDLAGVASLNQRGGGRGREGGRAGAYRTGVPESESGPASSLTPLRKLLVHWMTSKNTALPSTKANREDVKHLQKRLQQWQDAQESNSLGPVQPLTTEVEPSGSNASTPPADLNVAQRKKSLAQLEQLQTSDEEMVRIIRAEFRYTEYLVVDSRSTIMAGEWWFRISKFFGPPALMLWALGACGTLLCLFGVLPSVAGWAMFAAGLPALTSVWLLFNPDLTRKLLTNFEVLYLTALTTMATVVVVDVLKHDGRAGCGMFFWASAMTITFSDAAHTTHRKHITAGIAIGIICFLICVPGFYFGAVPDLNARNINLGLSGDVELSFNNVLFVVDKLTTVLLFLSKNMFTAVSHPGCYNTLKSRLVGEKMTAGDLRKRLGGRKASVSGLERAASLNKKRPRSARTIISVRR
jgi:hypothetical protein